MSTFNGLSLFARFFPNWSVSAIAGSWVSAIVGFELTVYPIAISVSNIKYNNAERALLQVPVIIKNTHSVLGSQMNILNHLWFSSESLEFFWSASEIGSARWSMRTFILLNPKPRFSTNMGTLDSCSAAITSHRHTNVKFPQLETYLACSSRAHAARDGR